MNTRRKFLWVIGAGALAAPLATIAQQSATVHRIAYLTAGSVSSNANLLDSFRQGLREHGYVEGKNIIVEYRGADGVEARLKEIVDELVRLKVEVIVTGGPQSTLAAKQAGNTVAVVMTNDTDPVGAGLVASLSRPGGNVTGLTNISSEVSPKRLELLKEAIPGLSRVAVFGNAAIPGNTQAVKELQIAASKFAMKLQYLEVRNPADIENAFKAATKDRAQALVVLQNFVITNHRAQFRALVERTRLPTMNSNQQIVEDGGFMFYGPSFFEQYRRAAIFVDKILKGAKPGDIPVEQPTKFELVVNMKTAKALGIKIPNSILIRADKVIE